jgi:hypothetical protein
MVLRSGTGVNFRRVRAARASMDPRPTRRVASSVRQGVLSLRHLEHRVARTGSLYLGGPQGWSLCQTGL